MDFWRAVDILSQRKWLILLSVVVTTALTFGATRLIGSNYRAVVRFTAPLTTPVGDLASKSGGSENGPSEYGPFAKEAAKNQAAFFATLAKSRDVLEPALRKAGENQLPSGLLDKVTVETSSPRLYELQVNDTSSLRAQALANALAESLVEKYHELNTRQAEQVVTFAEGQLHEADGKLALARSRLDAYRAQHELIGNPAANAGNPGAGNIASNLDIAFNRLKSARAQQDAAQQMLAGDRAQLREKERQLALLPAQVPAESLGEANPLISHLQESMVQAELQLATLRSRYADQHPMVRQALEVRDVLNARLKEEIARQAQQARSPQSGPLVANPALASLRNEIARLKQDMAGIEAQAQPVKATVLAARAEIDRYKGVDSTLGSLTADVAERMETRSNLAARLNSARVALDITERQNPIAITDPVSGFNPPTNTSQSRNLKMIVMATLCAMLVTSGLAIALDSIDRRVRSVREAEVALPARILAAIPQPMGNVTYATLARATELYPQSLHAESYRFLGLHLLSAHGPDVRSLMVLSAKAEQGSTTTLANLAITLAQAGKRVIAVDANMRTAELHAVFELPNEFGFADLLRQPGNGSLDRALQATSVPNLQVITSGPTPRNPWEMFRSSHLYEISGRLKARADYVLYDTPSALIFTDALNLAPIVDGAFLCVRALEPLTGAEKRLVELLGQSNVTVLGCVLNDVPAEVVEGYPNYQHYYGAGASALSLPSAAIASDLTPENGIIAPSSAPVIDLPRADEDARHIDT